MIHRLTLFRESLMEGSFEYVRDSRTPLGFPLRNRLLVCPWCKEIWAEFRVGSETVASYPNTAGCDLGPWTDPSHPVPGSLLENPYVRDGVDLDLLYFLPPKLLEREFHLTLKALA